MSQNIDTVPDDQKEVDHVIPQDIWDLITQEADATAEAEEVV